MNYRWWIGISSFADEAIGFFLMLNFTDTSDEVFWKISLV